MKKLLLICIYSLCCLPCFSQIKRYHIYEPSKWADSVFNTLTLEEKIGQLFMVAAYTSYDKRKNSPEVVSLIQNQKIGGVIFFKGGPGREANATNLFQEKSKIPLLVGMDAEWGLAMRLDSTINFGYQMPLGAISDDSIVYQMAKEIAVECKRMGIHINFAPVADINNNPQNPVINVRSFGENKEEVTKRSIMYLQGLQDNNIMAVAKHFPGHGNVNVDSHLDLPVLNQSKTEMDSLELFPFRYLFSNDVAGVMTAHLRVPAYDSAKNVGASLSSQVSTCLLRTKMNFNGIAFSDALNMGGVSKYYSPGELELKALLAGNDILLYSENVPKAIEYIKAAIDTGCLDIEIINAKVKKILQLKKWVGLDDCKYISTKKLYPDLNTPSALLIKQKIAENSVTLVRNSKNLVPFKRVDNTTYASLSLGTREVTPFQDMIQMYSRAGIFSASLNYTQDSVWQQLYDTLITYDVIIISLHNLNNKYASLYNMSTKALDFIKKLNAVKNVVLVNFGTPYALQFFKDFNTILCAYEDEQTFQYSAAQVLFSSIGAKGRLPVNATDEYKLGTGNFTTGGLRMHYSLPENASLSSYSLRKIDTIVEDAIKQKAFPGCQVIVARWGQVVYNKSYGYQTYDKKKAVKNTDLYDLASITKVAATTLCIMKLYELGKIKPTDSLVKFLPELKKTNKAYLTIKEVMTHQAGLTAWIPFYKNTITASQLCEDLYCSSPNNPFSLRVAEGVYLHKNYKDSIYQVMDKSAIHDRGKYKYSDLGFIYMQRVVERITGKPLEKLADSFYYKPLSLATITFKPREKFSLDRIAPTEQDTYFRNQLIHGDVHDPAAAMFGGVSGHAGLFSDANDLAVIMQMLMNGGTYAGQRFLDYTTIKLFTSSQIKGNRRGLGWDKPIMDKKINGPTSTQCSPMTYGHTGFTGTSIWADPYTGLIYIFLSNRINPDASNSKITDLNIRTRIQDVIYDSLQSGKDSPTGMR
ncbi:MAG: serine hydrolase [Bacteroidetes bacterium]|nr:serine hydrolase [Bacteroidota bacterium]